MNPELTQQTAELLKALSTLHQDAQAIYVTLCVGCGLIGVLVGITLFKR